MLICQKYKINSIALILLSIFLYLPPAYSSHEVVEARIQGEVFGIKADYNGRSGTDNRQAFQAAIDYCSKNGKTLILPKGKILINSYGTNSAAVAHGNMLELRSNLRIVGNGSEIVIGKFFNDKSFIFLSGFNNASVENFTKLDNIHIDGIVVDFNAGVSFMRKKYLLRKGIEFGEAANVTLTNSTFKNGDLTCAVASGYGKSQVSTNVAIFNNKFINLVKSVHNMDHTSVYLNSANSRIYDNIFSNSLKQGRLVACAAELHNSNTTFVGNSINNYTRMLFLAALEAENLELSKIEITNNRAQITNSAIYLWLDENARINDVLVQNNQITNSHVKGEKMLYNGMQGILADSKRNPRTLIENFVVKNNSVQILHTEFKGRAVRFDTQYKFQDINNSCIGCNDEITGDKVTSSQ